MRVTGDPVAANNGLFYIHSDHLGSTSVLTNYSDGYIVGSLTRYTPFGSYRTGGPNELTDRAYTGQRENMALGLYYYNARYYVPGIGRFLSADTIVPDPASPQSLNRYTYVLNSPLNYSDPTGHCPNKITVCIIGSDDGLTPSIQSPATPPLESTRESSVGESPVGKDRPWPDWTYSPWFPDYITVQATGTLLSASVTVDTL